MSLKFEIETWVAALDAYKSQDYDLALDLFGRIEPNSKMMCNIGLIYAALGEHEAAVENFGAATTLDPYLAIAHFQAGVSNFLLSRFEEAFADFEDALDRLRGNQAINYEQLGLKFVLFSAEVLFNKGLVLLRMGRIEEGMQFLHAAQLEKATPEHDAIDEAIEVRGDGWTVFSISLGILYEPSANKVKNSKARDWLGKARLITSTPSGDAYASFSGPSRQLRSQSDAGPIISKSSDLAPDDSVALGRSRSATIPTRPVDPDMVVKPLTRGATVGAPTRITFKDTPDKEIPPMPRLARSATTLKVANAPTLRVNVDPFPKRQSPVTLPSRPGTSSDSHSLPSPGAGDEYDTNVAIIDSYPTEERTERGVTQIYDGLLDSYSPVKASPPPALPLPPVPALVVTKTQYAGDAPAAGNGQPQRRPTLRTGILKSGFSTTSGTPSRSGTLSRSATLSRYEDVATEYWPGEEEYGRESMAFTKIRIKLHFQDDVRGMAIPSTMSFDEFMDRVCAKFNLTFGDLRLKFEDEDGGRVTLQDESDFEMAIETARENSAKARSRSGQVMTAEGKLSVWCELHD